MNEAPTSLSGPDYARVRELAAKPLDVQRRRRPGQWVSAAVVIGFVGWLIRTLANNKLISWPTVGHYLFSLDILHGLLGTLELTGVSMTLAIVLGFILAALGASANPVLIWFVRGYVWIFRGVPLIVQLLAWYNLALVYVIGGVELLTIAQRIYSVNFEVMALLTVASIWYLTIVSVLTIAQHFLERRLNRNRIGRNRSARPVADPDFAGSDPQL